MHPYSRNNYFNSRCSQKPTKKLAKFVRSVVSASTGTIVKYPRTDPPPFKADRPWRRTVRTVPGAEQTSYHSQQIANTEATFYGLASSETAGGRWQSVKPLAVTVYGAEVGQSLTVTVPGQGDMAPTTYTDHGDLNHRPCIKIIFPPTTLFRPTTNETALITFLAGSVDLIDFYVEFS